MEDTEQRQAPKPFLWPFATELNFTNTSFRDLSAFEHDYSFTYWCDYKYIISLRFCFIKIINYRSFLAAVFSHTYHTKQQILFTTRKIITYIPKAENTLSAVLKKSFLLCSESLAGSFIPQWHWKILPLKPVLSIFHWNPSISQLP